MIFCFQGFSIYFISWWGKIYDLDEERIDVKRRTSLRNVRTYYDFFKKYEDEFLCGDGLIKKLRLTIEVSQINY